MIIDSIKNFLAQLGTTRDKASGAFYTGDRIDNHALYTAYRFNWLPKKVVNVPAEDAVRNWRNWQAEQDQITAIEAEETRLQLRAKELEADTLARLYGGAAIATVTVNEGMEVPLDPDRVRKGGISHLLVFTQAQLRGMQPVLDVLSPMFGRPEYYEVSGNGLLFRIHHTRLSFFTGAPLRTLELIPVETFGWGDSVLQSCFDACKKADSALSIIISLMYESNVDVFGIPGLTQIMADETSRALLVRRAELNATMKGNNGMIIKDAEETYERKTMSFAGLNELANTMLQVCAGASDIPATRLLGRSPAGLNSTGESDMRNYYDSIKARQTLNIGPALARLDQCIIKSALGTIPPDIHYVWAPLWQATESERSENGKRVADTIKTINDTGLIPPDAMSKAAVNMLTEWSVTPGLDQIMSQLDEESAGEIDENSLTVVDAKPRTLYVSRKVTNAAEIMKWAKEQGIPSLVPESSLHVTITYSRDAVDWMKMGTDWSSKADGSMIVPAGGARLLDRFDGGALVLLFNSSELSWRHQEMIREGASWDYPDYQPHLTLSYDQADIDLAAIKPYRGEIHLGPEIFEEISENWRSESQ